MARKPQLLDAYGRPVRRAVLTEEIAAPTVGGVRSPLSGYPADGLDPVRLASILRSADAGDPIQYLELAETIEERDLHYLGVLGTRKRSVSQIEISVEPGGESDRDADMVKLVEDWLKRDELAEELFHILDALGKGWSFTEIIWDASMGQWSPDRLEWRDPRWFRPERHDLATPMMLDEQGMEKPLPGFKFITARMQAKSGLPLRGGLARPATWAWMFKAYTQRDWAIFTQTYGQPLRIGKFGAGASEKDKDTLFNAVANIAGDCAAIIPESMAIDFVEAANLGTGHSNYKERADWLDKQISKAVLGQTSTTDAEVGGLGSGKEHREVQEDIERADCRQLAAILNRDLIRPWMELEFGPQPRYPRLKIERPEQEDLAAFSSAIAPLIAVGLRVSQREVLTRFGLEKPRDGEEILQPVAQNASQAPTEGGGTSGKAPSAAVKGPLKGLEPNSRATDRETHSLHAEAAPAPTDPVAAITDRLADEARPAMAALLTRIEAMLEASSSLEELREMLLAGFPDLDASELQQLMAEGFASALAAGRLAVTEESGE